MSSTTVTFRNRQIDASSGALETWLRLLVAEIDAEGASEDWILDARADWFEAATSGFGFEIAPELDAFVTDDGRRRLILTLCDRARARLAALGSEIAPSVLNEINVGNQAGVYIRTVKAVVFAETADRFISLLRETPL